MRDYEKVKQNVRNYYWRNKAKINEKQKEKLFCETCQCYFSRTGLSQHKRTKKHIENLN